MDVHPPKIGMYRYWSIHIQYHSNHYQPLFDSSWYFCASLPGKVWHSNAKLSVRPVETISKSMLSGSSSLLANVDSHKSGLWHIVLLLPSGYVKIAIGNSHRNSWFTHKKWWFSIAMLVYQRVICINPRTDKVLQFLAVLRCFISTNQLSSVKSPKPHLWHLDTPDYRSKFTSK